MWYNVSIDFECSNGRYNGLIRYKWNFYLNGINYGAFDFLNNITQIDCIKFISSKNFNKWSFYFDAFNFSWDTDFNIINCIFLDQLVINYLERENIRYLILSEETLSENNSDKEYNILNDLISNFFIQKLYQYQGFAIYFAPI